MISRIPDPDFVKCVNCIFRKRRKVFNKTGKGYKSEFGCTVEDYWRKLYGQSGCVVGRKWSLK